MSRAPWALSEIELTAILSLLTATAKMSEQFTTEIIAPEKQLPALQPATGEEQEVAAKSKPQWGTITCQSGWLLSKSLQAINAGEGVEKREPSYTVGGNAN